MAKLDIQAPWTILYNEIKALFRDDPDVRVDCDESGTHVKLYVDKVNKAEALTMIMPTEREFGNVKMQIEVIPPNDKLMSFEETFETAFAGNPCFAFAKTIEIPGGGSIDHVMFKPKAAQFFADDLFDLYGNYTMLYQDMAKDIFGNYDPSMHIGSSLLVEE